jgi:hypothetical protein
MFNARIFLSKFRQGVTDKVVQSKKFRAAISCVETAHPSSLHVSIMWFSCELRPLIWGIGACTLCAQSTSTSAVRTPSIAYWRISRSWIVLPRIFESNQPRETRMSDLGSHPREVWKQPDRLPAEGRLGSSENTSMPRRCLFFVACLALFEYVPLGLAFGANYLDLDKKKSPTKRKMI